MGVRGPGTGERAARAHLLDQAVEGGGDLQTVGVAEQPLAIGLVGEAVPPPPGPDRSRAARRKGSCRYRSSSTSGSGTCMVAPSASTPRNRLMRAASVSIDSGRPEA